MKIVDNVIDENRKGMLTTFPLHNIISQNHFPAREKF